MRANLNQLSKQMVQAHDGQGQISFVRVFGGAERPLPANSSLNFVDVAELPPGTSVGLHAHIDTTEVYLVLEGHGVYEQDGKCFPVQSGDILVNHRSSHALRNDSEAPLKIYVIEAKLCNEVLQ